MKEFGDDTDEGKWEEAVNRTFNFVWVVCIVLDFLIVFCLIIIYSKVKGFF